MPNKAESACIQTSSHLFDILLEQTKCQSLMKFDFLGVPLLFKGSMVVENLMDHCENMTGSLGVVSSRIACLAACCFVHHLPIHCDLKLRWFYNLLESARIEKCKYFCEDSCFNSKF